MRTFIIAAAALASLAAAPAFASEGKFVPGTPAFGFDAPRAAQAPIGGSFAFNAGEGSYGTAGMPAAPRAQDRSPVRVGSFQFNAGTIAG